MPVTIIGETSTATGVVYPTLVYVRRSWSDEWTLTPALEFVGCSIATAAAGLDSCTLQHKYGYVKMPWETGIGTPSAWGSGTGWWVRVIVIDDQGWQVIFTGRISGEGRAVHGTDNGPSGIQEYQAYGPLQMLEKLSVSTSFWDTDQDDPVELGWLPGLNDRDGRGTVFGNRSADKMGDSYAFGTAAGWSHLEFCQYILDRFVQYENGPRWTMGGQHELLDELTEIVPWGKSITAAEMLRALIPVRLGLDFSIVPTDDGFEINVFALTARDWSFNNKTLPKNPNTIAFRAGESPANIQTTVVSTSDHLYSKLRVLGRRIVVCCTLWGETALRDVLGLLTADPTLVPKWSDELEGSYKMPTIDHAEYLDRPVDADAVRQQSRFEPVYQFYGAPTDWDMTFWDVCPELKNTGELNPPPNAATAQVSVRSTLPWLPLFEGKDYSTDPPTDVNLEDVQPELQRPLVWLYRHTWAWQGTASPFWQDNYPWLAENYFGRYVSAPEAGISVSVPRDDWGVVLNANPNHILGLELFNPLVYSTMHDPLYDHRYAVATIAFETDHRLQLTAELPGAPEGLGTLDLTVDDAEMWILTAHTAVGISDDGQSFKLSGDQPRVLRNDSGRLAFVMAGALSKYFQERMRAKIVAKGLRPWGRLLGHVLAYVEEAGSTHKIQAPITSVSWTAGGKGDAGHTVVSTGFAG